MRLRDDISKIMKFPSRIGEGNLFRWITQRKFDGLVIYSEARWALKGRAFGGIPGDRDLECRVTLWAVRRAQTYLIKTLAEQQAARHLSNARHSWTNLIESYFAHCKSVVIYRPP